MKKMFSQADCRQSCTDIYKAHMSHTDLTYVRNNLNIIMNRFD